MTGHVHHETVPRAALAGAAALILGSLILAAVGRQTGLGAVHMPVVAAAEVRDLHFQDRSDGSVGVFDTGGVLVAALPPGTNGFARGVLRGLARERKRESVGAEPPFRLTRWADGRLTLDDPSTGRHVDLDVFGPTNVAVFAGLMGARAGER